MQFHVHRSFLAILVFFLFVTASDVFAQQPGSQGIGTNYETRLSTLEDMVRALNGRVEQLEFSVRRLDQGMQRMQGDYDNRLAHLEATEASLTAALANMPPPQAQTQPAQGAQPQPTITQIGNTVDPNSGKNSAVVSPVNTGKAPVVPEKPVDNGLSTQDQYERAFGLLRQADYDNAEKAFKSFIDKNPKDKLIDNAKYWYGETLYVRGRFDEAAVAFADAYQQNPQGNKAPDSLLKLAMSLSAIDKVPDACTTLSELKNKYPNAAATVRSRADEERQKLKCGVR